MCGSPRGQPRAPGPRWARRAARSRDRGRSSPRRSCVPSTPLRARRCASPHPPRRRSDRRAAGRCAARSTSFTVVFFFPGEVARPRASLDDGAREREPGLGRLGFRQTGARDLGVAHTCDRGADDTLERRVATSDVDPGDTRLLVGDRPERDVDLPPAHEVRALAAVTCCPHAAHRGFLPAAHTHGVRALRRRDRRPSRGSSWAARRCRGRRGRLRSRLGR